MIGTLIVACWRRPVARPRGFIQAAAAKKTEIATTLRHTVHRTPGVLGALDEVDRVSCPEAEDPGGENPEAAVKPQPSD